MNETLKTISQRYSCRAYMEKFPEIEKLQAIALAAVQSPSAMNKQPWEIIVLTDKVILRELEIEGVRILSENEDKSAYNRIMSRGGKIFYDAPVMFIITKLPNTELDTGIISENIALAATSLGLGNVICGMASIPFNGPKGDDLKKKVGIKGDWEFGMAVLVGFEKNTGEQHEPDMSKIRFV